MLKITSYFVLFALLCLPINHNTADAATVINTHDLKIRLQKLQHAITELHDLDKLKSKGISPSEIKHMKTTLHIKIQHMIDDTLHTMEHIK